MKIHVRSIFFSERIKEIRSSVTVQLSSLLYTSSTSFFETPDCFFILVHSVSTFHRGGYSITLTTVYIHLASISVYHTGFNNVAMGQFSDILYMKEAHCFLLQSRSVLLKMGSRDQGTFMGLYSITKKSVIN